MAEQNGSQEPMTTQRAYTLRLRPATSSSDSSEEKKLKTREVQAALWATHEVVNNGAKLFGDWLLTLRGGLDHKLADSRVEAAGKKPERDPTAEEKRDRRILLALSWLAVESERGAPPEHFVQHDLDPASGSRKNWKTEDALRMILQQRGVSGHEAEQWVADCKPSLSAAIREDAVWVNRSQAFDALSSGHGVSQAQAQSCFFLFFGPAKAYLAPPRPPTEDADGEGGAEESTGFDTEFRSLARGWVSANWGTGPKTDREEIAKKLQGILALRLEEYLGKPGADLIGRLSAELGKQNSGDGLDAVRGAIGWRGRPSKGRLALEKCANIAALTMEDIKNFRDKLESEASDKGSARAGDDVSLATALRKHIEMTTGLGFITGRNLTGEFSVMLDHAARRVSAAHTWIKKAEQNRRQFEADAKKIDLVPQEAKQWLDQFCLERSTASGALDPYRIRRRAVAGWEAVVKAWRACHSEQDRVAKARELQDDPEIKKFGDIQLFEALASDEARCVRTIEGKAASSPLLDYVAATNAEHNRRRFKVPAYRHPDPFLNPVFCEFGNSRWTIRFAAHKKDSGDQHGLRITLWNGSEMRQTSLRWQSKRLARDLALQEPGSDRQGSAAVTRADRLGRAVVGVDAYAATKVLGIFEAKEWNGRLQAPRDELEAIVKLRDGAQVSPALRQKNVAELKGRLQWLITFSPRLQPQGPWVSYAEKRGLMAKSRLTLAPEDSADEWRGLAYPFWHPENEKGRQGMAKHLLSRLPSLRILSVDLGHRFAAACAVWHTLSSAEFDDELERARRAGASVQPQAPDDSALFAWVQYPERQPNKSTERARREGRVKDFKPTRVYRRIGPDMLPDGQPHPAPWARFDRQFLIKLQGEEREARAAAPEETEEVRKLKDGLGGASTEPLPRGVDELMAEGVRTARLGLKRHGDRARISWGLTARRQLLPGGREANHDMTPEERTEHLQGVLMLWHDLFSSRHWKDDQARKLWDEHIGEHIKDKLEEIGEDLRAKERKEQRRKNSARLKEAATRLARQDNLKLHAAWATRWRHDDAEWRGRLRRLRHWILPRGARRQDKGIRRAGGLSLARIATLTSLYQVQKAFRMRPEPQDLRQNISARGDDALRDFGKSILQARDRMRENRVKQLASRIAEAALGAGKEQPRTNGKEQRRPRAPIANDPRFAPCQAVVVENLTYYRPEETRARRENRQLASWSAGKVKKRLAEACQLYGLHLREVAAAYTSRQDSRTGAPGMRCQDVPVKELLAPNGYWASEVRRARRRLEDGDKKHEARDLYLIELYDSWKERSQDDVSKSRSVRVPVRGGEIFVSADPNSSLWKGLQADLNAAANIGLKALLDPDWPGRWWYVPCEGHNFKPVRERVGGSRAFSLQESLGPPPNAEDTRRRKRHAGKSEDKREKSVVNRWRDPSARPFAPGDWKSYNDYWSAVENRVVEVLRGQTQPASANEELPF